MHVDDRDDLREMLALQRCLSELRGHEQVSAGVLKNFAGMEIPRRGRRRKVSDMLGEQA